ncbi:Uncharacterized protein Rs2_39411 [Raphanus sativus]|nr:Uncharacterized protein Rs2_39411 [Raphanus sativus]
MADRVLFPPVASLTENVARLPPPVVTILGNALIRRLNAAEWTVMFDNAELFGPGINALRVPVETEVSGYSILDTCFNLTSYQDVSIPTIKMIFQGNVVLEVDVNGVFYYVNPDALDVNGVFYYVNPDASLVCLALASLSYENEVGIIENYQQKNQSLL